MNASASPTEFARAVYACIQRIPRGRVMTYAAVARWMGRGSPRAVGRALGVNPFAPEVPCHRVVAADGSLHGFRQGRDAPALADKRRLLESEGVVFTASGRVDASHLWTPPPAVSE